MSSTIGNRVRLSIFGESHGEAIGCVLDGLPAGEALDMEEIRIQMARRAPGRDKTATTRLESDTPVILSGTLNGRTTGAPLAMVIRNENQRSGDYQNLEILPRPGHADYTARLRYGDDLNMAGGGPFSARMTAPLCIAGGIALQMLEKQGITTGAHIYSIGDVSDIPLDPVNIPVGTLNRLTTMDFPVLDEAAGEKMKEVIMEARNQLDSVGGIIEGCVVGLPGGIGGAMYDGLESALAPIFFGIPAVKGVEFGAGFSAAAMRGSEHNDPFYYDGDTVKTVTNNHGGILGGITTGMPLTVRLAFKPTSSISRKQKSVDLEKKENTELVVKGRHDPCVVVRAVPIVEAALALGILDCIMEVNND